MLSKLEKQLFSHEFRLSIARWTQKPRVKIRPTTRTATTMPRVKNLIGRVRKKKRAARAARIYKQVRAVLSKIFDDNLNIWFYAQLLI